MSNQTTEPRVEVAFAPTYRLSVVVPGRPSLDRAVSKRGFHAEAAERKRWRRAVCLLVSVAYRPTKPLERSRVHFDCYRAGPEPDRINLAHSCKPLLDALQPTRKWMRKKRLVVSMGCGVIVDDKPAHCEDTYQWHRAKRGEDRVVITVEEIEAPFDLTYISLGAGVQSSTLYWMADAGLVGPRLVRGDVRRMSDETDKQVVTAKIPASLAAQIGLILQVVQVPREHFIRTALENEIERRKRENPVLTEVLDALKRAKAAQAQSAKPPKRTRTEKT